MPKISMPKLSVRSLYLPAVLLLALVLRAWGLGWGLPSATHYFSYHPDETVVLGTATGMNVFAGRLLPHFYNYGSLHLYLVCSAETAAALAGAVDIVPKAYAVWYPEWAKMYAIGRWLTVGMGVGTVWAVWAIGRRLWGERAGLTGALTLAILPLHAQQSHFLTVDVPAAFWGTLSLLWAVRLGTGDPKPWRAALWAGVFAGLAAATKYNLALMILPLLGACFMAPPAPNNGGARGGNLAPAPNSAPVPNPAPPLLGAGGAILAFLLACPGAVLEHAQFVHDLRFEAVHVQNADDPTFRDTGNGFVYQIVRNLDAGLGLPLLVLTLAAVGYALYRRQRGDGLLALFALPYYVLISLAAVRYARYTIPLLPVLALWTGRLLADGSRLPRFALRVPAAASAGIVLLLTLLNTVLLEGPMARLDPRDEALQEINHTSPTATVGFVVQPWFGSPPVSPYFPLPRPGGWRGVLSEHEAARIVYGGKDWDAATLRAKKPDYVALSEYDYDDALRLKDPAAVRCLQALQQGYQSHYVNYFSVDFLTILDGLPTDVAGWPTRGLPHDMTYTNPVVTLLYHEHLPHRQ